MDTPVYATRAKDGTILKLKVVPRSSRTEIVGITGDALKIKLKAPPVDGKANQALMKFLRKQLDVAAASVELITGRSARNKSVKIVGVSPDAVHVRLGTPGGAEASS